MERSKVLDRKGRLISENENKYCYGPVHTGEIFQQFDHYLRKYQLKVHWTLVYKWHLSISIEIKRVSTNTHEFSLNMQLYTLSVADTDRHREPHMTGIEK